MNTPNRRALILAAAAAALLPLRAAAYTSTNTAGPVQQGQTNGVNNPAETITFEGQGSLNGVIGTPAFGYLNLSGTGGTPSVTLHNGPGAAPVTYSNSNTTPSALLNLASQNFTAADTGVNDPSVVNQQHSALRLEWHWNGTVDGSNDLINDQVGYAQATGSVAPQQGANRGPTVANPIYVNSTARFDGTTAVSGPNNLLTPVRGFTVSRNGGLGTYNTYSAANYDPAGNNLLGGTNRVQFSFSDYKTIDYSLPGKPSAFAAPGSAGYGLGNPAIPAAANNLLGIGVVGAREAYQSGTIANMPTTNVDPSTVSTANPGGTTYAAGPWNAGGLDNLASTPVAANAVLIAANPGTGLSRFNLRDSQWVQTTGRLANGLMFNTVTRDADLGQRPAFAAATGIDSTWAVGVNDGGDTTATANAVLQRTLGTIKFSGKSSDTEVRNAIVQSRMGLGVLALNSTIAAASYGPLRSLSIDFDDQTDPRTSTGTIDSSRFVAPNLDTISSYAYRAVILGYVTTVKQPNPTALAAYESAHPGLSDAAAWAQIQSFNPANPGDPTVTGIKGDTTGDVARFATNLLTSQGTYDSLGTFNDPADAFLVNSYLLPTLLANQRDPATGAVTPNPSYDADAFAKAKAVYVNKFNANAAASYGKATETTGVGSYYGSAAAGGSSPATFNGSILIRALNADGSNASDTTLAPGGNWLFGNFNQNGVRDFSAVRSALSAARALYAAEPAGTTGANSAFNVSTGTANANNATAVTYADSAGTSHTLTKGDLIVMGDALSAARFDGASLGALARGSAVSDAAGTAGYTTGTLAGGQAAFADAVRNGVSRKNDALAYFQSGTADAAYDAAGNASNGSAFLRQTGRAVLTAAGVPRNATPLNSTDASTGLARFTYDPAGVHAFDNHDVNLDGVVDFNDAVLTDNAFGADYANLAQQLATTQQSAVSGVVSSLSLVNVKQADGSTVIDGSDLAQVNAGLTGAGTTNWYAFGLTKTGPGTVTWARPSGTVTVYAGAAFNVAAGRVTVASAADPFTDSSATGLDTAQSVAATVGGTLEYAGSVAAGAKVERLASLAVPTGGQVTLDASTAGRTVLTVGTLAVTGGTVDVGNGDLIVRSGNLADVTALAAAGFAAGTWSGTGLTSATAAADAAHLTAVGVILNQTVYSPSHPFDGVAPAAADVLVRQTYYGDANLDGVVNAADYTLADAGAVMGRTGWFNGDFNYDGVVDGSDYALMDNAFNQQSAALVAVATAQVAPVPEPAGLAAVAVVGLAFGRRRRS